jgi:hypothetical protein
MVVFRSGTLNIGVFFGNQETFRHPAGSGSVFFIGLIIKTLSGRGRRQVTQTKNIERFIPGKTALNQSSVFFK